MVAELKDLEWEKYRLLNTKDGYNSDKVLKLINFKNQYDIEFAFNKLKNENLIFDKNDKEESIRTTLYKSKFGCQLFILNKYIKNKIHYAKHILQVNSNNSDELSVLLQIYEKVESNPSLIDKIHLYYTYATRKQEKSYAVSNEFNLKLLDEIFNKDFIKKNVIKSNLFECISKQYNETNEYILGIYFPSDYQRIAETYEKPITYNPKESFIIYYDSKNNNFVFRGSTKYAAKYKGEIEKALNTKLYEWDDVVDYDANKFTNRIQNNGKGKLLLTGLYINGLSIGKNIDILLSQTSVKKAEICNKVRQLIDSESIIINSFKDISYLKIFYQIPDKNNFKEREIRVIYDASNTKVKLVLDNRDLVPDEKEFLLKAFQEEFGIPLEKTLNPQLFKDGIIDFYRHIIQKYKIDDIDSSAKELFDELKSSKLISVEEDGMWYCQNCETYNIRENKICDNCSKEKDASCKIIPTYKIDNKQAIKLTLNILKELLPESKYGKISETDKLYNFTIENDRGSIVYVILSSEGLSTTYIKKLKLEANGIIFILANENSTIDNIIKDSDLFQNIPLEYILSYNNVDGKKIVKKHVINSYNECLKCANVLVENGAKLSLQNAEDVINAYKKIDGKACDLFEVDVYNLIHYAFRTAKQLGKTQRGKSVADGYFDINIIQTSGVNETKKYTLMWDAKYSELEGGYDFSVGEKRKIADYISNAIENYELTNYSSQNTLDAFLIVYNNMDCKKFEQISKDIRSKIKGDWSGKLVFIDLTAIRTIVKYIYDNKLEYEQKRNIFNKVFIDEILNLSQPSSNNYNTITDDIIDNFIKDIKDKSCTETSISYKVC